MVKVWRARESVIKFADASTVTITSSDALDTFFSSGTSVEGNIKNVTIVEPELAVEKIDLLGETSNFQNQVLEPKPVGLASISGTLVMPGDEVLETFFMGSGLSISTTHVRYQVGSSASGKTRTECAILVNLDDNTDEVNIVMDDALITKLGDKKITADGHWEQDFEAVCLASDYYVEYKV